MDSDAPGKSLDVSPDLPIRCLVGLPLSVLRRPNREMLLDDLLKHCLRSDRHSFHSSLRLWVALMARLMEFPNATSRLATDAAALWELADSLDVGASYAFEELVKLTLGHLISTKEQDRSRKYLKKFHSRLSVSVTEGGISLEQPGTQYLVKASLSVFWLHRKDLLKPLREKDVIKLRRIHLDGLILGRLNDDGLRAEGTRIFLSTNKLVALDCMLEYRDLLDIHEQRLEGRSPGSARAQMVVPADLSVTSEIGTTMLAIMPVHDDNSRAAPQQASTTDRAASQALTLLYSLSSYTQDDRGTDFKNLSLLLELLRISAYNPFLKI